MKRTLIIICTALASAACQRSEQQELQTSPALQPAAENEPMTPRTDPYPAEPGMTGAATAGDDRVNMSGRDENEGTIIGRADNDRPVSRDHGISDHGISDPGISDGVGNTGDLGTDTSQRAAEMTGKMDSAQRGMAQASGDQSQADRAVTQRVQEAVGHSHSGSAKNMKITTQDGVVKLRGPVKSSQEKAEIAAAAQRVEGVKRVDNQLEISAK